MNNVFLPTHTLGNVIQKIVQENRSSGGGSFDFPVKPPVPGQFPKPNMTADSSEPIWRNLLAFLVQGVVFSLILYALDRRYTRSYRGVGKKPKKIKERVLLEQKEDVIRHGLVARDAWNSANAHPGSRLVVDGNS